MFSCLWQMWDWLGPTSMESKKGNIQNAKTIPNNEIPQNETIPKNLHLRTAPPQHIKMLQYGLNHQNAQLNQCHPHQQLKHIHLHQQLPFQPATYQHYQTPPPIDHSNIKYQQQYYHHQHPPPQLINNPLNHQNLAHYQVNQTPPLHPHTIAPQKGPDVWVPQQNPIYTNQNNKIDNIKKNKDKIPELKQKPKENVEKKKSINSTQLRSPSAKRPLESPVTMQGWLYKQGSDGLMLWKKRWFVLSEYCLFYYKSSEEQKLLGSILLPSYKVSMCGPDDKVNKKYAFKCEHTNMRTYILAADTHDVTLQWIRLLNLACNLQNNVEGKPQVEVAAMSSIYSQENSVSGFPQQSTNCSASPLHVHSSSNVTDLSNPSQQELSQYNQPLYANAPPKPRRLNETHQSSPSPDVLEKHRDIIKHIPKSPLNFYGHLHYQPPPPDYRYKQEYIIPPPHEAEVAHNMERRTPDTYGRSKLNPSRGHPTDYEDIYTDQAMYKRPLSPLAYSHVKTSNHFVNTPYKMYHTPLNLPDFKDTNEYVRTPHQHQNITSLSIQRPHSADFLEYELNHRQPNNSVLSAQQPRPKSSLDINRRTNDSANYFYSEERYAENMRKSTQYLPRTSKHVNSQTRKVVPNLYPTNEKSVILMRQNAPINFVVVPPGNSDNEKMQSVRCRSVLSEGSLPREMDIDLVPNCSHEERNFPYGKHDFYLYDDMRNTESSDPFPRSASARLTHNMSPGEKNITREGERKREESMKRLLEWKQKMLHSPLNRKVQNYRLYSGRMDLKDCMLRNDEMQIMHNGNRSVTNLSQYNSYSSDDEDNVERSKENVQSQAGRTLDTFPSNSELLTPAHSTPITVFDTLKEPDKSLTHSDALCNNSLHTNKLTEDIEESQLTEPLTKFERKLSNVAHVSSLKSEFSHKFEPSPIATQIKSNGALVKSILAEFERKTDSLDDDCNITVEENYVSMTSKKNILDPQDNQSIFFGELDENPYVEMTSNIDMSLLDSSSEPIGHQSYEMVYFKKDQFEPVYVELKHPILDGDKLDLPDIVTPQNVSKLSEHKSDSSDADDEASKDLDSLDTPSNPRFSLSDNFRPASYYLGAIQTVPEFQDSSDSELVSPPPIPTSPLPLEDLDSSDFTKSITVQGDSDDKPSSFKELDAMSFSSINSDSERRFSSRSHNSESDIELRTSASQKYRLMKRRPVSKEFDSEFSTNFSDGFDKYLTDLEIGVGRTLYSGHMGKYHEYENLYAGQNDKCILLQSDISIEEETPRCRPESSTSTSAEICDLILESNRSTPSIRINSSLSAQEMPSMSYRELASDSSFNQSAPYYYSDLSVNTSNADSVSTILTLNNQRGAMNGNKKDITHIVNPIKCNSYLRNIGHPAHDGIENTFKLAAEARSASVDFLNLTDKTDCIDKKNIYESDTLKRLNIQSDRGTRNLYPANKAEKFKNDSGPNETLVRRSYSLEGLLENVLSESTDSHNGRCENRLEYNIVEGSYLWEEDSIWHERLRSASQRHTKSMDDLDSICENKRITFKNPRSITRGVTYVNDYVYCMPIRRPKDAEEKKAEEVTNTGVKKDGSFIIDREKLRQWDLMSSAPSDDQTSQEPRCNNTVLDLGNGCTCEPAESVNTEQTASGSISINTRDAFSKTLPTKRMWPLNLQPPQSRSVTNLTKENDHENSVSSKHSYLSMQDFNNHNYGHKVKKDTWLLSDKVNVSAGELLGRTHEELVLLLIQLRRQSSNTLQAIENAYNEIDTIQAQVHGPMMNQAKRLENLQKLEQIRQHLLELEKQYEKGKPLVNLVDNMVKLGSLYRSPNECYITPDMRNRLEFNQQIQERRLLAEERRDWNRLNPNQLQLQEKVQQLYKLDRLIQEESGTLQNLQQDKEDIERALSGLRYRLNKGFTDPTEIDEARKQQANLENELSRVLLMLAQNSKKLEETVAGNARLEQELLVLKQKLQISRQQRTSPQFSNAGDSLPCAVGTSAMLESDLQRVQQKVGDLQKQRQEICMQVRQLTDRSQNLQQQIKSSGVTLLQNNQGVNNKKKTSSVWRETDLDTMNIIDHGDCHPRSNSTTPIFVSPDTRPSEYDFYDPTSKCVDYDENSQSPQLTFQEKQEIKTVRIVKRESERRQRDREKIITSGKWDPVREEESLNMKDLYRPVQKTQSFANVVSSNPATESDEFLNRQSSSCNSNLPQSNSETEKNAEMSPIFKSEAAKEIINEMSVNEGPRHTNRRAVPKEKRRHHTAPHNNIILRNLTLLPSNNNFDKIIHNDRRARDDLDMERALRQRIDAPDVVRSTLSNKELKYNESTIDNILGTPNKISIPERYIPEQLPQLTAEEQEHRLKKVESIKKMLSDAAIISSSTSNLISDEKMVNQTPSDVTNKVTTKMIEEKKQREHLLHLNQILAQQVMEMSKIVAGTNKSDDE